MLTGNLDLGDTLGCGGDTDELEVSEELVVADELTLSLRIGSPSVAALAKRGCY